MYATHITGGHRLRVGTALVVHHDACAVEFYVRLEDQDYVEQLRGAPVRGLFFEMSKPIPVDSVEAPLEYNIEMVESPDSI